ncbi:CYTH and CHAD domain-containing protein [Amycolatopsis sp. CA-230715]|uniref:CYTH and CHAD domain-containing protein n=1 Tax=Amycolatopsis sp. CA-230715 TaxID=2745196 RepID=UPI001C017C98|nr:CYTH and CHAD domain-containing protein [Amycolatopsis sp. CA-230715]
MAPNEVPTETVLERERKFEVDLRRPRPDLTGVGPIASTAEPVETTLDATYFDTEDHRLAAAGVTLRRRRGGADEGWHLKLPVGEDRRDEIRMPLSAKQKPPRELRRLVVAHTMGRKLIPVAHLKTERAECALLDGTGTAVAALTDDKVTGEAVGGAAHLDRWREWEVELGETAGDELLESITAALAKDGVHRSRSSSKLARLLDDRLPKTPKRRTKRAGDVVLAYLREQVDVLRRNDIGVRRDAEDAVHQMRVASRRIRGALNSFKRVLDRDATRELAAELKWLAGGLGPARDIEVSREYFGAAVAKLPDELVIGPVRPFLSAHFAAEADQARRAALKTLSSDRYEDLLRGLDRLLTDPPFTKRAKRTANGELRYALRRADRRLRAAARVVAGSSDGPERDAALHELRKKAKQARYAADAVRPVFGAKLEAWRRSVKKVQSTLGDHHDLVVARTVVVDLGRAAHREGHSTFTFGVLHEKGAVAAAALDGVFRRQWHDVRRGKRPNWLA